MVLVKHLTALFFFVGVIGVSSGSVYEVGDSHGWNNDSSVDYTSWASTKNFHVGDIIRFVYNPLENNVMQVSRKSFHACNSTDFVSVIISGNDSIPITRPGHYYYICGVPGHCQAGQKVDIRVPKPSSSPAPSASPSSWSPIPPPTEHPSDPSPPAGNAPSPSKNTASPSSIEYYSKWLLAFHLFIAVGFLH
ncbi:mavicyanin-like [Corylus avellana]|uniref:mavicyanin-like n=1 Tax=Corylus avellana TaxID=13451 RepID=UPI001E22A546|nr:mavicyanin-like [Corylus avellana]